MILMCPSEKTSKKMTIFEAVLILLKSNFHHDAHVKIRLWGDVNNISE
jgi:hypothetical protein